MHSVSQGARASLAPRATSRPRVDPGRVAAPSANACSTTAAAASKIARLAERRTAYRAHRLVASAAPPRRPEETASPMADDEIYFDPADFEDEDDEPAVAFALDDDDDDEDDDDDDSWFFVPEGANVSTKEEDLYVVGDDYDDDESFGFAQGFTDVTEQDDDEVDGYRSRTKKGGKSNLRRRERNTPADVNGIKDGLKVDANNKGELTMNNKGELTTKQLKELAKKEEETEKMLEMGVPKALLRKLESEKRAVDAFNVQKQKANSRRTHKRLTIVAGSLSKRKLLSPSGLDTRPMMGMVRGAAFDMIMSLIGSRSNTAFPPDSRWLDLFAGTGAIGIEAISRGCVESHFVEMDPWVVNNVTRKNLHSLGVNKQTTVHTAKVEQFLAQHKNTARAAGGAFDFVSFCPPYYRVSYPELLLELDQSPLIADHTVLLVEYARSQKPEILPAIGKRLRRVRDRRYGRTYVALYVCDGRELPDEDDEWADPVEEATKFGKAVRGGGKRDDDDI